MKLKAQLKKIVLSTFPTLMKKRLYKAYAHLSPKNIIDSEHDGELVLLQYLLNKDSVFFDIGSNNGTYAYFAEKIIRQKHIYLFEPEKELFFQLKKIYKAAQVFNIALSDKTGKHAFKIPFINGVLDKSLSTLEVDALEKNETKNIVYEVQTESLDTFIHSKQIFPDLIKIDVEGHELSVLNGAKHYTKTYFPNFIIEIEQRHHPNEPVAKVFQALIELGYCCFYYSKQMHQVLPYANQQYLLNDIQYFGTKDYVNNYIFIHTSKSPLEKIESINHELKK